MSELESTLEQLNATSTKASKNFLAGWGKRLVLVAQVTNVGLTGFLAGLNAAQEEPERALFWGISSGCFGLAAIVNAFKIK